MAYIHLTGHISGMNHVVSRYFSRYDIQLEAAAHAGMEAFSTRNPYTATLQKAEFFRGLVGGAPLIYAPMEASEAVNCVEDAHRLYEERNASIREKERELSEVEEYLARTEPFGEYIEYAQKWDFLHLRAGRMELARFLQYEAFLADDERIIFIQTRRDKNFVWGIYFTPATHADEADAVFAGLEFALVDLSGSGSPARRGQLAAEIRALAHDTLTARGSNITRLRIACAKVLTLYKKFDVKKYAAISEGRRVFTFSGWMGADDADALEEEIADDARVILMRGEAAANAPTRLRNLPIVRQFEFFTRLYGLPTYGESDPTLVLAVTYTLLFGMMFGDVGHGLVLAGVGALLAWKWKKPLGGIFTVVGVSAAVFGVLYGSIFGVETIIPALWRRPAEDITGTLIFALGLGAGLIVLSMLLHMNNALRRGDVGAFLFDPNGAVGMVFYAAVLLAVVRVMWLGRGFAWWLLLIPLMLLAFKQPLTNFMAGRRNVSEGTGTLIFRVFMELFETLLTYITNTISFVRVGAFAISHAGMMHVVLQLSQNSGAAGRVVIFILGNVLVMGIEGLLIGIQALRLDFYEIFSRFYTGGGRVFVSHKINSERV